MKPSMRMQRYFGWTSLFLHARDSHKREISVRTSKNEEQEATIHLLLTG
jgi:hypothetical protein